MTMSNAQIHWSIYESPIWALTLVAGPSGLTNLNFPGRLRPPPEAPKGPAPDVVDQLEAYFAGELQSFDLALDLRGTALQTAVWQALLEIPYGATTSYGELAGRIDASLYRSDVEPYRRGPGLGAGDRRHPGPGVVPRPP